MTTGFGGSADHQVSPRRAARMQRNLILYHLNGVGPWAAAEVVRATVLIRANSLARGDSGVRPLVVDRLLRHVAADVLPRVPERGSLGASGDLVPLCYVAAALLGEGEAMTGEGAVPIAEAQRAAGLAPVELQAKEGLALINGTAFTTAFAALVVHDAGRIATAAELTTALACEALTGNASHFAEFIHRAKPHPGQLAAARSIRRVLGGSRLTTTYEELVAAAKPLAGADHVRQERRIQDPYSLRCVPQVVGVLRDSLAWAGPWITTEMNASTDNPLFAVDEGRLHHGGNFYAGHVGQAMDALKVAVSNVADLLDRQLALLVDERFSLGLPGNLVPPGAEAGLHHGFKGMQIAASALTAEALKAAGPATVFSRSTEAHNQDKVSMATVAARDARTVTGLTRQVTAICLLAAVQAVELRGPESAGPAARRVHALIRERVPFTDRDRRMDHDIAYVADRIADGSLARAAGLE
ncbi:aromatic amino acid ammonia-lyase [Streptomyces sp. ITFR-16]|uniref:HAL/PAL/TAL family ammonia-lyase n=1 Tax=Streptomyces sp. ITFR-16 TaxID=3075198 RepID=UPI00288BE2D1|nr:aromatic amino acid ammonia-lyase [Streptomyces sp. ITFR-16]WNI23330.1 aromatic amino acid ammonia-lyase [Streptomyces sp. ITFR-16]